MLIATPELLRYFAHCTYMSEKYGSQWVGRLYARDSQIDQADIDRLNLLRSETKEAKKKDKERTRLEVEQMKQRRLNR